MTYLVSTKPEAHDPISLPPEPAPPQRGALPIAAAFVPVVGAVVMWTVTGSVFMLWFAALGPLMLVAGIVDRSRGARRARVRHEKDLVVAIGAAERAIAERHASARAARAAVHPSLAALCADAAGLWRSHETREDTLTVGTGAVPVEPDVARGDESAPARRLRAIASELADAPVVVPADGVCVRGPRGVSQSVARALLVQLCVVHPPQRLRVIAADPGESWTEALPHARFGSGRSAALVGPEAPPVVADVVIAWRRAGGSVPAACRTVIDLDDGLHGTLLRSELRTPVRAEGISGPQARAVAQALAARAEAMTPTEGAVHTADLRAVRLGRLGVEIGVAGAAPAVVDLVEDGPHAVVVGTTGAGKSELLITWALAMARACTPDEVVLMLADFKGGTAFTALAELPHVVGVLTDLDGALAERAVRSLAAEVRRRERVIGDAGARDVNDPRVRLPRLVVMIDEFPALVTQHPELEAVFTDIAARGRALGIHLIVGAQRIAGAVRDATLANMPLRLALRTADAADSRAVIGTDEAARLSGGADGRGVCFIRRSGDVAPIRTRIALTAPHDIAAVVGTHPEPPQDVRPWLPPLPPRIPAHTLSAPVGIAVGVADDPDEQRQPVVFLQPGERGLFVFGAARSGKSSIARLVSDGVPAAVTIPSDPEHAWDVLAELVERPAPVVVCDDLDILLAAWPDPWATEGAGRLERLVRSAGATQSTFVFTAQRMSGSLARIAELLPRRAVLAMSGRVEHLAAGGDAATFREFRTPGRGVLDGRETQFALAGEAADGDGTMTRGASHDAALRWVPTVFPCGVVMRAGADRITRLGSSWGLSTLDVADVPAGTDLATLTDVVLTGDPDQWQRAWSVLDAVRRLGELVVAAECSADVRLLTGDRTLMPYARSGSAWATRAGMPPRRVRWD